ncbi:hypothetical protein PC116_g22463 [Phytophthora cactorum]|uniref:Uncharacterized protein n=1 Tax=Phytophthora cactorum TaxID=29920 RepID=A0A8T1AS14_9STRA|nr:hypothetical protein Pcac1_g18727 [Phytophthora cactorum]KAG2805416.1 hypothetical protein PC112_g18282 [Phytophthora cactorum]KAG2878664.1 hypothetical protein PC115_g23005 [Phytophthora cactorum]KAG2885597.1 hypothetical protein PC117_g25555 [Phytophthora cactorum]KAG3005890.1 hypothetical protein PC120_g17702 [Phytophthora cactorum]
MWTPLVGAVVEAYVAPVVSLSRLVKLFKVVARPGTEAATVVEVYVAPAMLLSQLSMLTMLVIRLDAEAVAAVVVVASAVLPTRPAMINSWRWVWNQWSWQQWRWRLRDCRSYY